MKRAVIVGCGNIAAVHAAVLTAQKDTELVGVADIHFEKAQNYAERFHTKPYASLEEMIEKEQPDVLHVCTPHYLHVPMTQYALERGINVFMEKPPAITLAQLDQLKQAVYASKAKLIMLSESLQSKLSRSKRIYCIRRGRKGVRRTRTCHLESSGTILYAE